MKLALAAVALIGATSAFHVLAIWPLEERARMLDSGSTSPPAPRDGVQRVGFAAQDAKIAAFYRYFDRREAAEDWLARLYGMATAAGLELRAGEYRLAEGRQRLERYQLALPVTGSYPQVRGFLEAALAEIPVLSVDQVSFRKASTDARVEADLVLTLHLARR